MIHLPTFVVIVLMVQAFREQYVDWILLFRLRREIEALRDYINRHRIPGDIGDGTGD